MNKVNNKKNDQDKNIQKSHIVKSNDRTIAWLLLVVIVIVTTIVFSPIHRNDFLNWDDNYYASDNPDVHGLAFDNIKAFFSKTYQSTYLPLTMLSYALDYKIGAINPKVYTTTNLILHIFNSLLVFLFVFLLIKKLKDSSKEYSQRDAYIIAFITSLLFAIHPINVESVAWISERKNVLFVFFFILSLIYYLKYLDKNQYGFYLISVVFFLCSLLSKGVAVSLTLTIIAIDYLYQRKLFSLKVITEKIPYLLLSIVFGVIAIKAQGNHIVRFESVSFKQLVYASYAFTGYLFKLIFPVNLSGYYMYPREVLSIIGYLPLSLCIIGIMVIIRKFLSRLIIFAILFYLANIIFLIQLIPYGNNIMAERYIYVSSIGFFIIISVVIIQISRKFFPVYFLLAASIIIYGFTSYNRVKIWKNGLTFWSDMINQNEDLSFAWYNRAMYKKANHDLEGAIDDLKIAIYKQPDYKDAYCDLGVLYFSSGKIQLAMDYINKAVLIDSNFYESYFVRGNIRKETGDYLNAVDDLNKAIILNTDYKTDDAIFNELIESYNSRGITYILLGKQKEAMDDLTKAIELAPNYLDAFYNRGKLRYILKDYNGALNDLNQVIRLNPKHLNAYQIRAKVKLNLNDYSGSINDCNKIKELDKNNLNAYIIESVTNYRSGNFDNAIRLVNFVLQQKPEAGILFYIRGMSYLKSGNNAGNIDLNTAKKFGFKASENELTKND